ncbi:MAG: metalloregulator ArsR/SmtB family transcription factor [Candidatus Thermoplasmatota archaeon]|jgi:ArsR family transcriptional regulator|nr:metalloregulator ArsR/SmtB family transcription factor [Candidatus Thermoplasmatota archaeon]
MSASECRTMDMATKTKIKVSLRKNHSNGYFQELEKRAKALSDMKRIEIYHTLSITELCVCEISDLLGIPQSTVSGCIKELYNAKLINRRKEGKWSYYTAKPLSNINPEMLINEV